MANANKKQKLSESSSREFQSWWTEKYGMINKGDKAVCTLCSGTVVCRTSSVKRHYETVHKSLSEKSQTEQKELISQTIKNRNNQSSSLTKFFSSHSNITAASFFASSAIVKCGKSFSDGEYMKEAWLNCASALFEDFENKEKIIQRIKDMPLSRNTVKDRILQMAQNITHQQKTEIKSCDLISLCIDESTDITGSARLAIFVRYYVANKIKEELISLTSLTTTAKGTDICQAVVNALTQKEINIHKIVSVTTDGARSMIGEHNGFIKLFTECVGHPILGFHCIIHQHVLCAKTGFKSLVDILDLVTKLVNFISARALNKRKFLELLKEVSSVYNGLLMYNHVRWLSRGKVLERFVECLDEIRLFLHNEQIMEKYNELNNVEWLSKLMFFTDLCLHLNELNVKLQGFNKTIIEMFDLIKAFEAKLQIFNRDVVSKTFKYFPYVKNFFSDLDSNEKLHQANLTQEFSTVIQSISNEFSLRFQQFRQLAETTKFILYPDTISAEKFNLDIFEWLNLENIEMELIDFQSSSIWKQKFVELRNNLEKIENDRLLGVIKISAEDEIVETWNAIPETFSCLKKLAQALLSIFSSTYACESLFSEMNFIKNKFRNRLTDETSAACLLLKVTKYEPDIKLLASNIQQHPSN